MIWRFFLTFVAVGVAALGLLAVLAIVVPVGSPPEHATTVSATPPLLTASPSRVAITHEPDFRASSGSGEPTSADVSSPTATSAIAGAPIPAPPVRPETGAVAGQQRVTEAQQRPVVMAAEKAAGSGAPIARGEHTNLPEPKPLRPPASRFFNVWGVGY
jgi:hypothetical protein